MLMDLIKLTLDAGRAAPLGDVVPHTGPDKLVSNETLVHPNTVVRKSDRGQKFHYEELGRPWIGVSQWTRHTRRVRKQKEEKCPTASA